jgi:hypothetical protein
VSPEPFSKQYAPKGYDQVAARELYNWASQQFAARDPTPGSAWYAQGEPIVKNLVRKKAAGTYDSEKAAKLWLYFVDNAARHYTEQGAKPWHQTTGARLPSYMTKPTRMEVARRMRDDWERDFEAGRFDSYKKMPGRKTEPRRMGRM